MRRRQGLGRRQQVTESLEKQLGGCRAVRPQGGLQDALPEQGIYCISAFW